MRTRHLARRTRQHEDGWTDFERCSSSSSGPTPTCSSRDATLRSTGTPPRASITSSARSGTSHGSRSRRRRRPGEAGVRRRVTPPKVRRATQGERSPGEPSARDIGRRSGSPGPDGAPHPERPRRRAAAAPGPGGRGNAGAPEGVGCAQPAERAPPRPDARLPFGDRPERDPESGAALGARHHRLLPDRRVTGHPALELLVEFVEVALVLERPVHERDPLE